MDGHAEPVAHSERGGHGRQRHRPRLPTSLHDLLQESFPLIAEDLRVAREGLGITSAVAAERAELDPALYRALEEGSVVRNTENLGLMVPAAQRIGLEEVRFKHVDFSYLDDVQQQYIKVDLSTDEPLTVFLDTLSLDIREL